MSKRTLLSQVNLAFMFQRVAGVLRLALLPAMAAGMPVAAIATGSSTIVIAEFYASGSKTGATYARDYAVLKNVSGSPVSINGWSFQHQKAGVWNAFSLPNATIPAGGYYLIQCHYDGGTSIGGSLSNPDASTPATSAWNLSTSSAEAIAVVNNTTALTSCSGASIVDLVGLNSGTCNEGGAVAPITTATQSSQRKNTGCQDTDSNATDFALAACNPRNSGSAAVSCSAVSAANSAVAVAPDSLAADGATIATITITARDGANNPIAGIPAANVVVSATGTGNALTQPTTATDSNGQTTAALRSTTSEVKTVSVAITGTTVTQQPSVTFTNPPANLPPTIAPGDQPQSQSLLAGATAVFTVAAAGSPTLAYQWRKGGSALQDASNSSLTLTNLSLSNAGSYDVVVTNAYGAVTSVVAVLTVTLPPVTINASAWATVRGADNAAVDIDEAAAGYVITKYSTNLATGTGPAKGYLQFDLSAQIPDTNSSATFTFSRFSNSGAQNVTLWALNQPYPGMANTITWATAQANNTDNNSMLTDPTNAFTATAITSLVIPGSSGSGSITLSATNWGNFIQGNKLVLVFTGNDDAGNSTSGFRLAVTNSLPLPALTFSILNNQPPVVTVQPQSQTVDTGANVSISLTASGSAPLSYQWFNSGGAIARATNATLTLSSVTTNAADGYYAVLTNAYGSATSAVATLTVNPPQAPLVTQDPPSQSVTEGSPVSFGVTVTGSLPLVYQWYEVVGGITNLLTGQTNTTYRLATTTTNDNGEGFYVVITNTFGLATSELATLQVLPNTAPPTLASQPISQTVQPGANVTFSVVASGANPLSYQWFFNLTNAIANATNASLSLSSVSPTNQGGYDVMVTNAYGAVTSVVATLTVNSNASGINPLDFINPRFATVDKSTGITYTPSGYPSASALDLYQPHGDTNTQRPVIVWIHGGSLKTGTDRTQSYIVTYCNDFALRGYVCLAIDYRVHSGAFPCTPQEECSLPQLQLAATDTDTAFDWIRANAATYHINTNWMFVAGGSAGGMVAVTWGLVDGTNSPATPPKVFNHNGLIAIGDLWGSPEAPKRWYIGTNNPNQYNLPPYHYLDTNDAPLVIIHGTADTTVPFQNSIDLTNELTQAGVGFEIHPIPGAGHTPTSYNTDIEAWVANFFAQTWLNVLTPAAPTVTAPTVVAQPATSVTASGATLNAAVNPNGGATTCYFRYGQTTGYGSYTATNSLPVGTSAVAVNVALSGLSAGMSYHFQCVASNSAGTSPGGDALFTTVTVPAPQLAVPTVLGDGTVQFLFTSTPGTSYTVFGTGDLTLPVGKWTGLGLATEVAPGHYQFTDFQATNNSVQFYLLQQW